MLENQLKVKVVKRKLQNLHLLQQKKPAAPVEEEEVYEHVKKQDFYGVIITKEDNEELDQAEVVEKAKKLKLRPSYNPKRKRKGLDVLLDRAGIPYWKTEDEVPDWIVELLLEGPTYNINDISPREKLYWKLRRRKHIKDANLQKKEENS